MVLDVLGHGLPTWGAVFNIDKSMCQKRTIMEELFTER